MKIHLPTCVDFILHTLTKHGFDGYIVGGCVRDNLLEKKPEDYDICTNALPIETKQCFNNYKTIDTGMKHGTVTLLVDEQQFEITSYRTEGKYSDCRRPDNVSFVQDLSEDLLRRDFTINAMAYNPFVGLVDHHGGVSDLREGIIRAVGNPNIRFEEDALRIIRALRFASVLGFKIENQTSDAIHRLSGNVKNVSMERICSELSKLLVGENVVNVLLDYGDVFAVFIPELKKVFNLKQNNPYHIYDVYEHMVRAVGFVPPDLTLRLAMFLHDIEKPSCHTFAKDGTDQFNGHEKAGALTASRLLKRLCYDNNTIKNVHELIFLHDEKIEPNSKCIKRWLNRIGECQFNRWLKVRTADIMAQSDYLSEKRLMENNVILEIFEEIIKESQCYSINGLAVNGDDLIKLGFTDGIKIGNALSLLLEKVIDEEVPNDKDSLLKIAMLIQ